MKYNIENLKKHIWMMIEDTTETARAVAEKSVNRNLDYREGRAYELANKLSNLSDILDFVKEMEGREND